MPVTMCKALPDEARKMPESRHPDARTLATVLLNRGVSALAVRLKMCVGDNVHGPLSRSNNSFEFAGGLSSDCGRV